MTYRLFAAVAVLSLPTMSEAEGVLSTYMFPEGPPPKVTVLQNVNQFGVRSYTTIAEETITLPVSVYGGCDVNFRAHRAFAEECFQQLDGGNELVQACFDDKFRQEFDVEPDAKKFGPGVVPIEVPREFLTEHLTQAGEDMIANLDALSDFSGSAWRSIDLFLTVDWDLTFIMQCRRWFGGNQVHSQSSYAILPLAVTFKGLPPDDGLDVIAPGGGQTPLPGPIDAFTSVTHIHQAQLSILPDPTRDPCGYVLVGTLVTSAPTEVRYQIVDHRGARSAELSVDVGKTLVEFVSHDIDFAEGADAPLGFAAAEPDGAGNDGEAFSTTFVAEPTDNIQGFYRLEILAPHEAQSNIVSYNLDDCSGGPGTSEPAFSIQVPGDPDAVAQILQRVTEAAAGYERN